MMAGSSAMPSSSVMPGAVVVAVVMRSGAEPVEAVTVAVVPGVGTSRGEEPEMCYRLGELDRLHRGGDDRRAGEDAGQGRLQRRKRRLQRIDLGLVCGRGQSGQPRLQEGHECKGALEL